MHNESVAQWRANEKEHPDDKVYCVARNGSMRSDSRSDAERLAWLEHVGGCEGFLVVQNVYGLELRISLSNPQSPLLVKSARHLQEALA